MRKSAIYKIKNIVNGKIYIGSAVDTEKRWGIHKHYLRNCKHHSKHLQHAYNKYGFDKFVFEIVEEVSDPSSLIIREQYYIDFYKATDRKFGYNICPVAGSQLGTKRSFETKRKIGRASKGRHHSKETREKIGMHSRGKNNPMWGKECSSERKEKIGDANRGKLIGEKNPKAKLTQEKVNKIRHLYKEGESKRNLAKMYNVHRTTIGCIVTNRNWKKNSQR